MWTRTLVLLQGVLTLATTFQEEFATANIDNYGYSGGTFQLRYFISTDYLPSAGEEYPLLFYTGNEGDVELYVNNTGFMEDLAAQHKALLVYAEHRYYGKSLPFPSPSVSQLKYFSPHQALADYAYLISALLETYSISSVIAFGGSYGGMLASWMRIKFPHLVDGALASSAPDIHFPQITDPYLFAQVSTLPFAEQSSVCVENIKSGFQTLAAYTQNSAYYYLLDQVFQTCQVTTISETAELMLHWAVDALTGLATLNYPYEADYGVQLPANPVAYACNLISAAPVQTPQESLAALYKASNVYYNYTGSAPCTSLTPDLLYGLPWLWSYVRCTTLIMPIGLNGETDMFYSRPWDYNGFTQFCRQRFGAVKIQPSYPFIMYGATNVTGNLFVYLSNVIFSNGEIDPWQSGGVFGDINPEVTTLNIYNAAHHLDLRGNNTHDYPELLAARETEALVIARWISGAQRR